MNAFEAALAKAGVALEKALGEPVRITPMVPGRYKSAVPDGARAVRTVIGNVLSGPARTQVSDNVIGREMNTQHVVSPTRVIFRRAALTVDGVLVLPLSGDRLQRVNRPDFGDHEIVAIEPSGQDDFVATLVKVDA